MQIRNPYAGSDPLQITAITVNGVQSNMSLVSYPFVNIDDDVAEMLVRWKGNGYDFSKAWTKEKGWLDISEYEERKAFEIEKAELARQKERARIRTKPLEVKHEDLETTPDTE